MASAFAGGFAKGFLQAKLASEDAAAKRAETEETRKRFLAQQKEAQRKNDIQIARHVHTTMLPIVANNPRTDLRKVYGQASIDAYNRSGLGNINANGIFAHGDAIYDANLAKTQQEFQIETAKGILSGQNNPSIMEDQVELMGQVSRLSGLTGSKLKNKITVLQTNYNTKTNTTARNEHAKAFPNDPPPIEYNTGSGIISFMRRPAKNDVSNLGFDDVKGVNNLPDEQRAAFYNGNSGLLRYSNLFQAEKLLQNLKMETNEYEPNKIPTNLKNKKNAIERFIVKNYKQDFFNTHNDLQRNNGFLNVYAIRDKKVATIPTLYNVGSADDAFPVLSKVLRDGGNVDKLIGTSSARKIKNDLSTPEKVAETVSKQLDISKQDALDAQRLDQIIVRREQQAKDDPGRTISPNNPKVVQNSNRQVTSITVNPEALTQNSNVTQLPVNVEPPLRSVNSDGDEKFVIDVSLQSKNRIDADLNLLFSADRMTKNDRQVLFTSQPRLVNYYNTMKSMNFFKDLSNYVSSTQQGGESGYKNLETKVKQLFDIERNETDVDDIDSIQDVIRRLSIKLIDQTIQGPPKTTYSGNRKISVLPRIKERSDTKQVAKELKKIDEAIDKTRDAKNNAVAFRGNMAQMGIVDKIRKGNFAPQDKIRMIKALRINKTFNEDIAQGRLPAMFQNLGTLEDLTKIGFDRGSTTSEAVSSGLQFVEDLGQSFGVFTSRFVDMARRGLKREDESFLSSATFNTNEGIDRGPNSEKTVGLLKQVERFSEISSEKYGTAIQDNLEKATAAYKNKDLLAAAEYEALAHEQYLLAQNAMTKVTLTYTFAGMIQGESGGRAISNEDFAIIFQALWGGASGETGRGSFERLEEVLADIALRNKNLKRYIPLEGGREAAGLMLKVEQNLLRNKHADLYEKSQDFDLLAHTKVAEPVAKIRDMLNIAYPKDVLDTIRDDNNSYNYNIILNPGAKLVYQRRFNNFVVSPMLKDIPISGKTFYQKSESQQQKIFVKSLNNLSAYMYDENQQLNPQVATLLKTFGNQNTTLLDSLEAYYKQDDLMDALATDTSGEVAAQINNNRQRYEEAYVFLERIIANVYDSSLS